MYSLAVLTTLLATAFSAALPSQRVDYTGYRVVRVPTKPAGDDLYTIQGIVKDLKLPTWRIPTVPGADVDLMIPPKQIKEFEKLAKNLQVQVLHEDLGADIEGEKSFGVYKAGSLDDTWFDAYHSYDDHMQWLNDIQAAHADNSEIVVEGQSYEGRNITGIHIWGGEKGTKPAAVFHGTVHAREWITTMTVEYIINSILTSYGSDEEVKAFVDKYDIYFFPIVNPDGFVFTQEGDRMWRKNRQPNEGTQCAGVDLNRNWPYEWEGPGSSPDPCDEAFRGPSEGNAPETQAHTKFLSGLAEGQGLKIYIDFHSYSQLFMTPYGFTCDSLPKNNEALQELASTFADALTAVHGTDYTTGPICQTIYPANGNSVDWVLDVAGGETAFAAELRDTGRHGFILPPEQILPTGEETWAGFKALMTKLE